MAPSSTSNVLLTASNEPSPAAETAAVSLSRVTRVFGVTPALVRVDLEVSRGEVLLVRGPNGAGKSTLLAVLATALSPTYGTGTVLGFPLEGGREEIRRRTELIGHTTRLYEDLSGRENLRFWARLTGVEAARADAALEAVGLGPAADDRVRGYSQGMRQRVAVARATMREPDLLLLDEPYAGLDDEAKEAVDALVARTAARGATVVLATHDPTRGGAAGRTLFMDAGRIVPQPPDGGALR